MDRRVKSFPDRRRAAPGLAGLLIAGAAALAAAFTAAPARKPPAEASAPDLEALAEATRDLCGKDVVMLGEATHGDGRTLAFKAALIPRLVERCGFDAVFFEASHYDFLAIDRMRRRGQAPTRAQLASAIGGLWNGDEEMRPLIDYMFEAAAAGRLRLGGIDDNLGSAGAFYSLDEMPAELSARLAGPRGPACRTTLKRRIYYDYGKGAPYQATERAAILACLDEIGATLRGSGAGADRATPRELAQMLGSFRRFVERDFTPDSAQIRERDRSMYVNFRWLAGRLPPRSKIIVWGATSHMARDARASGRYPEGGNFGALVDRDYGARAFALGFSARGGAYRIAPRSGTRALAAAPVGSLEARAPRAAGGAVYLGPKALARYGELPAAPFAHEYRTAAWHRILDGLVLFPEERSPRPLASGGR